MPNFTRNAIKASFLKLLEERPLHQITIKDIVEDCGLNRNSFYYHFKDMPALLEEIIEEMIQKAVDAHPTEDSFEGSVLVILQSISQNKRAVYHIYNSVDHSILEHYLLKICNETVSAYLDTVLEGTSISEGSREVLLHYHQCECFGQIIKWLSEGMKEDIFEEVHHFCEISRTVNQQIITENKL